MKPAVAHISPDAEYYFEEGCYILELHNAEDDPSASVARARLPPGETTRSHRLAGIVERYVILEGLGRVEVEGMTARAVEPGAVVVIPAGASQRIANTGSVDLVFLAVCTPRFVRSAYSEV